MLNNEQSTTKSNGLMKDLKQDLQALRTDLNNIFSDGKDITESQAEQLIAKGNDIAKQAKTQLTDSKDKAVETVKSNPLTSAGVAFGLGALFALMTRR